MTAEALDDIQLDQSMLNYFANPARVQREAARLEAADVERTFALSSTINFAKFSGYNPWDFENDCPAYDEQTAFFTWCPYADNFADYLDKRDYKGEDGLQIPKPIKPGFIARDHIKTTIVEQHLAKCGLINPARNYIIICDKDEKADARLGRISAVYKNPKVQELFPDRLHSTDGRGKDFYKNSSIRMKRNHNDDPTFLSFGINSSFAGYHCNGKLWLDDLVNEQNYENQELMEDIWNKMQQIMQYVASPGCEVIITGTRYAYYDSYKKLFDKDDPIQKYIVPGSVMVGCTADNTLTEESEALFFFRFCVNPEDKGDAVEYGGKTFHPIRESLIEKKETTNPVSEFYAQMMNSPTTGEYATFKEEDFEQILPVKADELRVWLQKDENVRAHLLNNVDLEKESNRVQLNRGRLNVAVLGDPGYGGKTSRDFSVILVVAQDSYDYWYLMDGFMTRLGNTREYFRKVFHMRDMYGANKPLGIETHAKESSRDVAIMIANEMSVRKPNFHKLKDNSHIGKEVRIKTIAPITGGKKLFICEDFPKDVLDKLSMQAIQFPNGEHDDVIDTLANARQVFPPRKKVNRRGNMIDFSAHPLGVRRILERRVS